MKAVLFVAAVLMTLMLCSINGYTYCRPRAPPSQRSRVGRKYFALNLAKPGSYQQMLEQAQLKKQGGTAGAPQVPQPQPQLAVKLPAPKVEVSAQAARPVASSQQSATPSYSSKKSDDNGLPFSDEMYDHLKFVISKISARMKSSSALPPDELARFKSSVAKIIKDARHEDSNEDAIIEQVNQQPAAAASIANSSEVVPVAGSGVDDPFAALRGLKSTWEIPGMDKMTTEEYYQAVNDRLKAIRGVRRVDGNYHDVSANYMESLNRRSRQ